MAEVIVLSANALFGFDEKQISELKTRVLKFFDDFAHKPTVLPSRIQILPDHVISKDGKSFSTKEFQIDVDYFQVMINELYLTTQSKLWVKTDPTVLANTEFGYGGKIDVSVPYVVGPNALNKAIPAEDVPKGGRMVIRDKPVAGFYPFKGGNLR